MKKSKKKEVHIEISNKGSKPFPIKRLKSYLGYFEKSAVLKSGRILVLTENEE